MIFVTHELPVNVGVPRHPGQYRRHRSQPAVQRHVDRGMAPDVRGQCRVDVPRLRDIHADHKPVRPGRIMNMTSSAVGAVVPRFTRYTATKMAVIGLARGLATQLAQPGRASTAAAGHAGLPRWEAGS
jgi:NAD(P)-dependent dehydrogenase (short-subunit alcohol dehydrogenase family)